MARQDDRPDRRRAAHKAGRLAASARISAPRAPPLRPVAASRSPAAEPGGVAPAQPDPAVEARELFRAAVADARPLRQPPRLERPAPKVRPLPLQRWADDREVLTESLERTVDWDFDRQTGESLAYKREGVQLQVFRRLRRGHWVVQSELDLHGLTREEARAALGTFLAECLRRGLRCVRVIHGKGLGSRNREPVLKAKVAGWLAQREAVLAFCEAPPRDGGSGAVLVLLRAG